MSAILHPSPPLDLAFVDEAIAQEGRSPESLIPILQRLQNHYRYLPNEALRRVCALTGLTPAHVAGTASFYARFRRTPTGRHHVRVCHGTACHVAGAQHIMDSLRRDLHLPPGSDLTPDAEFSIEEVACLGCCSLAPVLMVDGRVAGRLNAASATLAITQPAHHP